MKTTLLLFFISLSIFAVYVATGEDEPTCYEIMIANNPPWTDIVHDNHSEDLPDHWHDGEIDGGRHIHENVYRTYECSDIAEAAQWNVFYGEIHRPREEQNPQHVHERPSEIDTENDVDVIHDTGDSPDTGFVPISEPPLNEESNAIPEVELVDPKSNAVTPPDRKGETQQKSSPQTETDPQKMTKSPEPEPPKTETDPQEMTKSPEPEPPKSPLIFNEMRNAPDDQEDWLEIKNISDADISLSQWKISIVPLNGNTPDQDTDIVTFPEYTLPADGILLIVNTDPSETSLLKGKNIEMPDAKRNAEHLYLVAEEMELPSTSYLLILRSATNKNGQPETFEDVARNNPAQLLSAYQGGVGYKPDASVETSLGTPGYPNNTVVDESLVGRITFSELMFATRGGLFSQPQWIELYNNTIAAAEPVNLQGWKLAIETLDSERRYRYSVIKLEALHIPSNQTVLLVTRDGRNASEYLSEDRVYNLYDHHSNAHSLNLRENAVLPASGFMLKLIAPDGTLVDTAGNLDGKKRTKDVPAWELPSGWSEDGARTSLIRRYEGGLALTGTEATSWVRAADVQRVVNTYYGHQTDLGTPGYRRGGPLPVVLSHFHSERTESGVIVEWATESEIDNAGFNILRSQTKEGSFVKVNPTLIHGAGTTAERNTYTWTDTTAEPNVAYYYRIEDVSFSGDRQQLATVRMRGHVSAAGKFTTTWSRLKKPN